MFPAPYPHAELQAIEAIEPPDSLAIDRPALPPQQHPDSLIAEPRSGMGQIPNAEPEGRLILGLTLPIPRRATKLGQATGPRTTHREGVLKPVG